MDKFNFVKDGAIKLPPGFRFQPTDEEIVFQYLIRKTFSCPLPASIIPEINISKHDPWDLPGDIEQDRYFFSNKVAMYRNRATLGGYWKPTGLHKQINCSKRKPILGMKKTLVFYKGKTHHDASRTDWIMHEYRLVLPKNPPFNHFKKSPQSSWVQIGNWVLCHIFLKERSRSHEDYQIAKPMFNYEFMPTSSSCSSSLSNEYYSSDEVSSSTPSDVVEHEEDSNPPL